jgi:hypothetical protein
VDAVDKSRDIKIHQKSEWLVRSVCTES